jgi:type I restriction enzyme S subunit
MNNHWKQVTLSEICSVSAGNSAPQDPSYFAEGTIPFFRTSDAGRVKFGTIYESQDKLNSHGASKLRRYPAGTILFPKSGASTFLNHRVVLGVEGCVSSHLATIVPDLSHVLPQFLLYALTIIDAKDLIQDQSYPSLNLPAIEKIRIYLPPLTDQERIARQLDEAFEGIAIAKANAKKNVLNASVLLKSHLQAIFRQDQEGWGTTSLAESCEMYQSKTISVRNLIAGGKYPVYGANGIIGHYDEFNHEEPQLLIGCRGTCGVVNISQPYSWITGNAMVIRSKDGSLNMRFLEYLFRGGIDVSSAITGTAQPQITRASLSPLKFSYPAALNEQLRIVASLDKLTQYVGKLMALHYKKIDALDELNKSMLRDAFNGSSMAA